MDKNDKGYEYEVVGKCPRTGKPIVAPKCWSGKGPRPHYATCTCCNRKK